MMDKKPTIIHNITKKLINSDNPIEVERYPSLLDPSIMPLLSDYFDITILDEFRIYDRNTTIFVANAYHPPSWLPDNYWYRKYIKLGYKIVLDNLFEDQEFANNNIDLSIMGKVFVLSCSNWFWYYEAMTLLNGKDNVASYRPNQNFKKLALMPINLDREHRRDVLVNFVEHLDKMYWSYASYGRRLPNDIETNASRALFGPSQRYFNSQWYNDTCLSLVVETKNETKKIPFITEKTYKPIAFHHPFMVLGSPGTLQHLRSLGFETYDNLWDESYDQEDDWMIRLEMIRKNLEKFETNIWHIWKRDQQMDPETCRRVKHNHDLFFNVSAIKNGIEKEIITPMLKYFTKVR